MRIIGQSTIEVILGDITQQRVDAIVNAANTTLLGGGGVDGAIHRAGGPSILAECRQLGGCPTGDAKLTTGGNLPARFVIHTVGPVYQDGKHAEAHLLASCYRRSLEVAVASQLTSVAFPAVSCGVYGYPLKDAAAIAVGTIAQFLVLAHQPMIVKFVLFTNDAHEAFRHALSEYGLS